MPNFMTKTSKNRLKFCFFLRLYFFHPGNVGRVRLKNAAAEMNASIDRGLSHDQELSVPGLPTSSRNDCLD